MRSIRNLRVPSVPLACVENEEDDNTQNHTVVTINDNRQTDGDSLDNEATRNVDDDNNRTAERGRQLKPTNGGRRSTSSRSSGGSGEQGDEGVGGGMAASLEDLVSNFDEKITECFKDPKQTTDAIAPVPVRSQEEVMSESQMWWTLTGNYGNMAPIDWSKTQARQMQLPALNLRPKRSGSSDGGGGSGLSESDEELAAAMDLHSLIAAREGGGFVGGASPHSAADTPTQTADQAIEEIDEIMQASSAIGSDFTASTMTDRTMESADSLYGSMHRSQQIASMAGCYALQHDLEDKVKQAAALTSSVEKLKTLRYSKLVALQSEMESLIQAYNEALVQELALKDELEYEKEIKNAFISLLLSIQNKRRHYATQVKKRASMGQTVPPPPNGVLPQYLTAVIPYQESSDPPDNNSLQALIKILKAVNEDNQTVPNMLTDYILNVVCASQSEALRLH